MPRAMPGRSVTMASAWGPAPVSQGVSHRHDIGAVDLGQPDQRGQRGAERRRGAGAVLHHGVAVVAAGQAAVEAGERSLGDAAAAGEEAMPDRQGFGGRNSGASGAVMRQIPGASGSAGSQTASALNSRPMACGSVSRLAPSARAAARAGGWPRGEPWTRCGRPSRARNRPCGTGPWTAAPAARAASATAEKSTCAVRSARPGSASGSAGAPPRSACRLSPGAGSAGP